MRERYTILVVDDEPDVVKSLYDLLRTDYRVVGASSGREAVEIVEREKVHVVVADHRMPDMTGTDLLRRLRNQHPEIVRLLMTAYADVRVVADAVNLGSVYRYLPKPWEPEELKAVLREACEQYKLDVRRQRLHAVALRHLHRYRHELHDHEQEMKSVLTVAAGFSGRPDVPGILDRAVTEVAAAAHAKAAAISLLSDDRASLILAAQANLPSPVAPRGYIPIAGSPAAQQALAAGRPVYAECETEPAPASVACWPEGATTALLVPILHGGRAEGLMQVFLPKQCQVPACELAAMEIIAAQIGTEIAGARLHEEAQRSKDLRRSLEMAAEVQRHVLPPGLLEVPGFQIAAVNSPGAILSGDFYDFIDLPPGNLGILVGDAMGEGPAAALTVGHLRSMLRASCLATYSMRDILARVNHEMCSITDKNVRFATLFYGVLNLPSGCLTYANAGHCQPFLVRSGLVEKLQSTDGLLLGVKPDASFDIKWLDLRAGDVLAIYSDGLPEAFNGAGELFGTDRLAQSFLNCGLSSAPEIVKQVMEDVRQFTTGQTSEDDCTLVVIRALDR